MQAGVYRGSLSEQVAESLGSYLLSEDFQPGQSIPGTSDLAKHFDVSVPVVREAVAHLVGQGRLRRSQGKATVIRVPTSNDLSGMLQASLIAQDKPVRQLHEYRVTLELGAARLAARNAQPEQIEGMYAIISRMRTLAPDSAEFLPNDIDLHQAIAESTGNSLISMTMAAIDGLLYDSRVVGWTGWIESGHEPEAVHAAHEAIIDAIAQRDENEAVAAMAAHLRQAEIGIEATEAGSIGK